MNSLKRLPSYEECEQGDCQLARSCIEYLREREAEDFYVRVPDGRHCPSYMEPNENAGLVPIRRKTPRKRKYGHE